MMRQTSDTIELVVCSRQYDTKIVRYESRGKVIEKEVSKYLGETKLLHTFEKSSLRPILQYMTKQNKPAKKRAMVFDKITQNYYIVASPYEQLRDILLSNSMGAVGFKR